MTTNQLAGSNASEIPWWPGVGYGLGVGVQLIDAPERLCGAFGWIGISGTTAWIHPKEEMIVIDMPQALFYFDASTALLIKTREIIAPDVPREQLRRTK